MIQTLILNKKQEKEQDKDYVFWNKERAVDKIRKVENIAQLLYQISIKEGSSLTYQQQRHFDLKASCDIGNNYRVIDCSNPECKTRHFIKTSCGSFFCKECKNYNSAKIRRKAEKYLWHCNHFFAVFTFPMEIQNYVTKWDKYYSHRIYKDKDGNIRNSQIYYTDLVYKAVEQSLKEYGRRHDLEMGFVLMPHSYGSVKLNWFFHMNALISSKALRKNPDKKFPNQRVTLNNNRRLRTQRKSLANFRFIFGDDYAQTNLLRTNNIDYQFNYKELKKIYKEKLEEIFKINIHYDPQVKFAQRKTINGKKTIYVSYKKSIRKILNYFSHVPLHLGHIKKVTQNNIVFQTKEAKLQGLTVQLSHKEFFNRVIQHIPPKNFRTLRQYGLYSNPNKRRLKYPIKQSQPKKPFSCDKCRTILKKEDITAMVHNGALVFINPSKRSGLDYKDFILKKNIELSKNGRVMQVCEPPTHLKPKTKPEFPGSHKKDEIKFNGNNNKIPEIIEKIEVEIVKPFWFGLSAEKLLEKQKTIVPKEFFRNSIFDPIKKLMPLPEDVNDLNIIQETEPQRLIRRLYRLFNYQETKKIKLNLQESMDLIYKGIC